MRQPLPKDDKGQLEAHAWPGGYAIYYLDGNNSVLCPQCAQSSLEEAIVPKFTPVAWGIVEADAEEYCDECSRVIE